MMMQRNYWKIPAVVFCLAFGLVLAGCGGSGSPAGDRTHTPSWSGPHRLAAFDDFHPHRGLDITFGNGRFFAVGRCVDTDWRLVKTSTNGRNWSNVTATTFGAFYWVEGIVFGGGRFFAFGDRYDAEYSTWLLLVKTSTNGTTWTDATEDFSDYFGWIDRIVYSGGRLFSFGNHYGLHLVKTSTDGSIWTDATDDLSAFSWINDIVFGGGKFFAFGDWNDGHNWGPLVKTSMNGTSWTDVTSDFDDFEWLSGIAFGAGMFLAFGAVGNDALVKSSTNGTTWVDVTSDFGEPDHSLFIQHITFVGGRFFAFGAENDGDINNWEDWFLLVKSSTNGTTWVDEPFLANNLQMTPEGLLIRGVFYSGGRTFVIALEVEEVSQGFNIEHVVFIRE